MRASEPDLTIAPERMDDLVRRLEARSPPRPGAPDLRSILTSLPRPERAPAYGRLLADDEDNLWVSEYIFPALDPERWDVFDPSGRLLARAAPVAEPDRTPTRSARGCT